MGNCKTNRAVTISSASVALWHLLMVVIFPLGGVLVLCRARARRLAFMKRPRSAFFISIVRCSLADWGLNSHSARIVAEKRIS